MKWAVILHGTDANPQANWFEWIGKYLENAGYEVLIPHLPNNHTPNRKVYNDYLFNLEWDFKDNLLIGHSSGAVSVLNLIEDERINHIDTAIMVGAWATCDKTDLDYQQFKDLFPADGFDFELIKQKTDKLLFVHGGDDPFCPLEQAEWLAKKLDSEIKIIPNGHHLGSSREPEFPELLEILKELNLV